jgi:hypothetical protein
MYDGGGGGGGGSAVIQLGIGANSSVRIGNNNLLYSFYTGNLAGRNNTIGAPLQPEGNSGFSIIVGGENNTINAGRYSFIGGGLFSTMSNSYSASFMGAGVNLRMNDANNSAIVGGTENKICSTGGGFIGGGIGNIICGTSPGNGVNSVIVGGLNNCTTANFYNFIGGGSGNCTESVASVITGGFNNIAKGRMSFVGGGQGNLVQSAPVGPSTLSSYSSVVGGASNCVYTLYSSVLGGQSNQVINGDGYSSIIGGSQNLITNTTRSFIGAGNSNEIYSKYSSIINGDSNQIKNDNTTSTILNGCGNSIENAVAKTVFGFNTILGGNNNTIPQNDAAQAGFATIVNGKANSNSGAYSTILGGSQNIITASAYRSVIIGGNTNTTSYPYTLMYGTNNTITNGFLALGTNITLNANNSSAIGNNLTNTVGNSLLVNCLRAQNLFTSIGTDICANPQGTIIPISSDSRLKTDVTPINSGLSVIEQLNPVSFYWNEDIREEMGNGKKIGFIAQEIEQVIPEIVGKTNDGYYVLDTKSLIPIMTKAIQELKTCNDSLKERVNCIESILIKNNIQ